MRILSLAFAMMCVAPASAAAEDDWQTAGRLDAARSGLAAVVLDGTLYAAGGAGLTDPRDEFESYDVELDRWFPETPLPTGLERFGMSVAEDRIYIAGGYARGELGSVAPSPSMWSWSPEGRVWQSEAAMPAPRADFSLITHGDSIYAVGGALDDAALFVFDPEEREWESRDMPSGINRASMSGLALEHEILLAGGFEGDTPSRQVHLYDPENDSWRDAPDLPQGRAGSAIARDVSGRVHLFGGRGEGNITLDSHISWLPGEAGWRDEADLPSPRTHAAAASLDQRIYVIGGGSGGGFLAPFTALDVTDVFEPVGQ